MPSKEEKSPGNGIDQLVCDLDASAFPSYVIPDIFEIGYGLWS
ncbi:MAG: hypothetical protein ABSG02_04680 [Terriglobales bacterium]